MAYEYVYNLNQKRAAKKARQKEIILTILIFLALLFAFGIAGKSDLSDYTSFQKNQNANFVSQNIEGQVIR